jgi:hypothetical protein
MAKEKQKGLQGREGFHVQFNLLGLVIFSVSLVLATGVLEFALAHPLNKTSSPSVPPASIPPGRAVDKPPQDVPPWGEFNAYDIELERPEEYAAFELSRDKIPVWSFDGMTPDQVRESLLKCGLTPQQTGRALAPGAVSVDGTNTVIQPDEGLIFSLSPEVRSALYGQLAKSDSNHYMRFPFCLPGNSPANVLDDVPLDDGIVPLVRSLVYRRGGVQYFSDFEAVMGRIPSEEQRLRLVKALSRQSAVMVRLRIRPTTDLDKLLGYWSGAPGVRLMNVRTLLESIKRLDDGGSVSLVYLLPQFARDRLYTYPLPSQPGDPVMDCHWSTMNFFNDAPDNRFANPTYTTSYLGAHYYQVAKPSRYGDLIFLVDDKGGAIHSGVYLADDIIFTKNGNNYMEPWMLMRIKNLLAMYSVSGAPRVVVYRDKSS